MNQIITDVLPLVTKGFNPTKHKPMKYFPYDPLKIDFYFTDQQRYGKISKAHEVYVEMADKPVLNANVLDYYLANPDRIPDSWKRDDEGKIRYIFFWGTLFEDFKKREFVRCLFFDESVQKWTSLFYLLCCGIYKDDPAVVLKLN